MKYPNVFFDEPFSQSQPVQQFYSTLIKPVFEFIFYARLKARQYKSSTAGISLPLKSIYDFRQKSDVHVALSRLFIKILKDIDNTEDKSVERDSSYDIV